MLRFFVDDLDGDAYDGEDEYDDDDDANDDEVVLDDTDDP